MQKLSKKQLRKIIKQDLAGLDQDFLNIAQEKLIANISGFLAAKVANADSSAAAWPVLSWRPFFQAEPSLLALSSRIDQKIYYPRVVCDCQRGDNQLDFYCSDSFVADGPAGIIQPVPDPQKALNLTTVSTLVCLVPGLAFDLKGNRLGRGAGMYDRFLERARKAANVLAVGVCWSLQVVEDLETEPHDQKIDLLVTEKEIYHILDL